MKLRNAQELKRRRNQEGLPTNFLAEGGDYFFPSTVFFSVMNLEHELNSKNYSKRKPITSVARSIVIGNLYL